MPDGITDDGGPREPASSKAEPDAARGDLGPDAPQRAADAPGRDESPPMPERLRLRHLAGVLAFHAGSIRAAAASPWSLIVGLLLVLSGGIARHYDRADLLHQSELPLRGVLIAIANATILYGLVCTVMAARKQRWPALRAYLGFLGVFWLTAPMAWLYGIPYERWMSPEAANGMNLLTLGVVSLWRVGLMARVVSVLFGMGGVAATVVVMAFADTVAIVALADTGTVLLTSMGGLGGSSQEQAVYVAAANALFLSCMTWPLWGLGMLVVWKGATARWRVGRPRPSGPAWGALAVAAVSLALWCGAAAWQHGPQHRRYEVESALRAGDLSRALELLSASPREAFPPGWQLRSRDVEALWDLMDAIDRDPPPQWAVDLFLPLVDEAARGQLHYFMLSDLPWAVVPRAIDAASVRLDRELARARRPMEFLLRHDHGLSAQDRAGLEELVRRSGPPGTPADPEDDGTS